jgi:hypothetical protein
MSENSYPRLKFYARAFGLFFLISYGGGVLLYFLLVLLTRALFGEPHVFGALYRMLTYHEQHPFQYIALVALHYSLFASLWTTFRSGTRGAQRYLEITLVLIFTLLTSAVSGGILWKYHDMQAGYFPETAQMLADFLWGAKIGFMLGPFIVLQSIPLNLLALIAGYFFTHRVPSVLNERDGFR